MPLFGWCSISCVTETLFARDLGLGSFLIANCLHDVQAPSRPNHESRGPPPARFVLPALANLVLQITGEYSEDLLTRIETPLILRRCITFMDPTSIFYAS
jgi:hypothetical protein